VGLILIYLLVVAQFRSYVVPLVIMAPIPLTVIGVMPGHALLGANFTATSMIGMIALAGIIVRNSILLVDFVNLKLEEGVPLEEAVIQSAAARAKPIALTGLAAMLGAAFILDDPIFNGLAIALIFGILVSTVLTLVVIRCCTTRPTAPGGTRSRGARCSFRYLLLRHAHASRRDQPGCGKHRQRYQQAAQVREETARRFRIRADRVTQPQIGRRP